MSLPDCCYDYRNIESECTEIDTCTECGCGIYEGEEYYEISGQVICCDCIQYFKKKAEL
ncbi:hypothetical protein [Clostridium baratii]|uniref:hypothetical protein n=1 Tax=Clostridium baratii TaxID=1561 RepID=UPI00097FB284|nr:hypothetical protein [Clostridium baratii]